MLTTKSRHRLQPSFDFKRLSTYHHNDNVNSLEDPTQKTFEVPTDATMHKQISAPTVNKLTKSNLNLSCSFPTVPFSPQTPMTPSPKNMLMLTRRTLTKGYAKFVEDREFLSHRDEERAKVQESIKKTLEKANSKLMSEEIQRLICSTIVNEPSAKLKTLRRSAEIKNMSSKMPALDEKYKKICRRILGNDFESNELFLKEQEEAKLLVQHGRKQAEDGSNHFEYCWKKAKRRGYTDLEGESQPLASAQMSVRKKCLPRKLSTIETPFELTGVTSTKKEEIIDTLEETESTKTDGEDEGTNDTLENSSIPSQLSFAGGIENSNVSTSLGNKKSLRSSVVIKGKEGKSSMETSKVKPDIARSAILVESNKSILKESGVRPKMVRRGANSFAIKENRTPNIMSLKSKANGFEGETAGEIARISQMCKGAMRLTHKEGVKLRKRQVQFVKDYSNLDTKMERLEYENTVASWEKSVKEVYRIEQTSPFYNLVL